MAKLLYTFRLESPWWSRLALIQAVRVHEASTMKANPSASGARMAIVKPVVVWTSWPHKQCRVRPCRMQADPVLVFVEVEWTCCGKGMNRYAAQNRVY
jgi:hypothetical protein